MGVKKKIFSYVQLWGYATKLPHNCFFGGGEKHATTEETTLL